MHLTLKEITLFQSVQQEEHLSRGRSQSTGELWLINEEVIEKGWSQVLFGIWKDEVVLGWQTFL
jgi:hypothetical protein